MMTPSTLGGPTPGRSTAPSRRAVLSCAGLVLLGVSVMIAPLAGQSRTAADRVRDPNGHPFRTPAGSPLEPVHRLAVLTTNRDTVRRTIALAELGDRLGFWIKRDPEGSLELAGAVHAGAFSRFDLAGPNQDFIQVHYRVGFVLRARVGGLAARAELYHVSSHLGDEFLVSTGTEPISTSREGLEVLLQGSPVPGLTLYGGPGMLLGSSRGRDRMSLRGGAEWESSDQDAVRLYASAHAFMWSELSWDPALSTELGAALGRGARLGLLVGVGPSRAEQFFRDTETVVGVSLTYVR